MPKRIKGCSYGLYIPLVEARTTAIFYVTSNSTTSEVVAMGSARGGEGVGCCGAVFLS